MAALPPVPPSLASIVAALDETTRRSWVADSNWYLHLLIWFTVLLFAGVIIEEIADHFPKKILVDMRTGVERVRFRSDIWIGKTKKIGVLLAVIGIAGEGLGEYFGSWSNDIVVDFDNALITGSRKEAADANERAGMAIERAEQLARDNLVLQSQILSLREKMADRTLAPKQQRQVADALRSFRGQRFSIITYPEEPEPAGLARDIRTALTLLASDGLINVPIPAKLAEGVIIGVQIEVAPSRSGELEPAAKALVAALKGAGVFAFERPNRSMEAFADRIVISVGKKPTTASMRLIPPPAP